ncbi:bifunctional 2-keto-4-hydroxyglutarate aldolase/2-keto-3-deoxy-6-phosphogluconate aldolase [Bacillus pinisoli]|uniref:bifunctional 2-keto-4-hydroxyglutarate aldolase/2-keto-3-deoxy-6-phosphogluconate aldolase n=1 Tax=Bacillus pinisoli TaxID=2901866 RepID=UPI001FF2F68F|nr:bifunctional 2-keto-4-hydroxyglutarate aldolase/2-keto-3-deoxy-6-phosphogluconate aldolase [Bacillus pinisoli]
MRKIEIIQQIRSRKLIAVVRSDCSRKALQYIDEIIAGGIKLIEVTMTTPFALDIIKEVAQKYQDDNQVIIGAGTVLDSVTARLAILNGAEFIVSPSFDQGVVQQCHLYQVPILPGVMSVNEAVIALQADCPIVKLFPGDVFQPSMINNLKGPLPQLEVMPTGGVNLDNIKDWLDAGAFAIGIGSDLTKQASKTGDLSSIKIKVESYLNALRRE